MPKPCSILGQMFNIPYIHTFYQHAHDDHCHTVKGVEQLEVLEKYSTYKNKTV